MATVRITCPHCGLTKEVPEERVPQGSRRVTCPNCKGQFDFRKPGPTPETPPADTAPATPPGPGGDKPSPDTGSPEDAPRAAEAAGDKTPRHAPPPVRQPAARGEMTGIGELFDATLAIYKRRVLTLLGLMLLPIVPVTLLVAAIAATGFHYPDSQQMPPFAIALLTAASAAIFLLLIWFGAAFVFAVADEGLSFAAALGKGWRRIGPFLWLSIVFGFIIQGGILLMLIPGLIFLVWFAFCQFLLADDDARGMNALLLSREYVRGRFVDVALRLLIIFAIASSVCAAPFIGPILYLLFWPFAMIFTCLVYRDLREIRGEVAITPTMGEKLKFIGIAAVGCLVPVVLAFAIMGTAMFGLFTSVKSLLDYQRQMAMTPPGSPPPTPQLPAWMGRLSLKEVKPVSVSAAQYEAMLSAQSLATDDGEWQSLGPAALKADQFWNDAKSPHVWLKVRLAQLPNLELGNRDAAKLVIESVLDRKGNDVYDAGNSFETGGSQGLSLSADDTPSPHYSAIRNIHLREGTVEEDVARVNGALVLSLPLDIETADLDPSMTGKETAIAGARLVLRGIRGPVVSLFYGGRPEALLSVTAYGTDGKRLPTLWVQSTRGEEGSVDYTFSAAVKSVRVIAAASLLERSYPFHLTWQE